MDCEAIVRHEQSVAIVDLNGALTLGRGADTVRAAVGKLIQDGEQRILLNCAGINQVDSAGVGELVSCYAAAERRGLVLKLAGVRDRLANLIKLTGLDSMIEAFPEVDTALATFSVE